MTTPSGFHDDAWHRVGAHDRLQTEFLNFLWDRPPPSAGIDPRMPRHFEVVAEYPIGKPGGDVISYADVAGILTIGISKRIISLYEIKPRIDTSYGIVRQLKATEALAAQYVDAEVVAVHAVVPSTDSKLDELRSIWPNVWAWGWQHQSDADTLVNEQAYLWAWKQTCDSLFHKSVLRCLASATKADGSSSPSIEALCQCVHCDEVAAMEAIQSLIQSGLISQEFTASEDEEPAVSYRLLAEALS